MVLRSSVITALCLSILSVVQAHVVTRRDSNSIECQDTADVGPVHPDAIAAADCVGIIEQTCTDVAWDRANQPGWTNSRDGDISHFNNTCGALIFMGRGQSVSYDNCLDHFNSIMNTCVVPKDQSPQYNGDLSHNQPGGGMINYNFRTTAYQLLDWSAPAYVIGGPHTTWIPNHLGQPPTADLGE